MVGIATGREYPAVSGVRRPDPRPRLIDAAVAGPSSLLGRGGSEWCLALRLRHHAANEGLLLPEPDRRSCARCRRAASGMTEIQGGVSAWN
jgi:hypothetical protein